MMRECAAKFVIIAYVPQETPPPPHRTCSNLYSVIPYMIYIKRNHNKVENKEYFD